MVDACRNCGSEDVRNLGFVGHLAPFFLKRVFRMELNQPASPSRWKQRLRELARPGWKFLHKLYGQAASIEMLVCRACSFVQARYPFPEDAIARLYLDYRTDSYNQERIHYEPGYRELAARVGIDQIEVTTRVDASTKWLSGKLPIAEGFTLLDYGGADGRFLPRLPGAKYVYELSSTAPLPGITRVTDETLGTYSFVQVAQVLEHVVHPLELVRSVARYVKAGGYLYLEVPQEMSEHALASLQAGSYRATIPIHEHINQYSTRALAKLVESAGMTLLASTADPVDVGWARGVHLRALCRVG